MPSSEAPMKSEIVQIYGWNGTPHPFVSVRGAVGPDSQLQQTSKNQANHGHTWSNTHLISHDMLGFTSSSLVYC